ncbi:uncharacterized protein UTRI_02656_B [Ustilago trichophora]|uniref:Uncharacterized protein n=1 Tax=Ustilago trichophora TaxID=86804 RepID=A0A5C3E554_9BASI|nr:uncharacterized protein UTRI_02656_B [Ustilago trichophora]
MSTALQPEQASTAASIAPARSETLPPSLASTDTTTATVNATQDPQKAISEPITGLTPQQVFQELQKCGYIDQLRRQMFDAFNASPAPKSQAAIVATVSKAAPANSDAQGALSTAQQSSVGSVSGVSSTQSTNSITTASTLEPTPTLATAPATDSTSASDPKITLDIGNKTSFLNYLSSGPLRYQVEKEHDSLRLDDARGQQSKLLKLLESENVDYPGAVEEGDATLYDLLVRHIVTDKHVVQGGTQGLLSRDGSLGRDVLRRIGETVGEMMKPDGKDDEAEDEEDDEDDEVGEEDEAGAESVERKPHGGDANAQPPSHETSAQTDMEQD